MPKCSIDYLNSRRESHGRKGRTIFAKASALVDQRAQYRDMDALERADAECRAIFKDFASFMANLVPVDVLMDGGLEDLTF